MVGGDKKHKEGIFKKLVSIGRNKANHKEMNLHKRRMKMANRNKNYNEVLAQKFKKPKYARGYLLNIIEKKNYL